MGSLSLLAPGAAQHRVVLLLCEEFVHGVEHRAHRVTEEVRERANMK